MRGMFEKTENRGARGKRRESHKVGLKGRAKREL